MPIHYSDNKTLCDDFDIATSDIEAFVAQQHHVELWLSFNI